MCISIALCCQSNVKGDSILVDLGFGANNRTLADAIVSDRGMM